MAKGLRIACFGASLVSAYEHGAAGYCRGVLRAMARRGHAVRFYEPARVEALAHRDILDPPWAEVVQFACDGAGLEEALEGAADTDVLVKCAGMGVFDELLDAAVPHCVVPPTLAVYWDLVPATTLRRLRAEPGLALRAQLHRYDLVLVRYGGEQAVEAYHDLGARTCFPVHSALDPDVHHPVAPQSACAADLLFIGHRADEREARMQRNFFDVAAALPARRFVLGGCGWENRTAATNVRCVGYVYTAEHNLYNCSATAVLNVTRPVEAALGHAPTARLFEAAGAGACIVSDAWTGIGTFLEPGREILVADYTEQVLEHLNGLSPERATAVGRRARERVRHEHTYDRRAGELEALLEGSDRRWVDRAAL